MHSLNWVKNDGKKFANGPILSKCAILIPENEIQKKINFNLYAQGPFTNCKYRLGRLDFLIRGLLPFFRSDYNKGRI